MAGSFVRMLTLRYGTMRAVHERQQTESCDTAFGKLIEVGSGPVDAFTYFECYNDESLVLRGDGMAETYAQMEESEISDADGISASVALQVLESDTEALLVDVRDTSEMEATGIGLRALCAPGRAVAWMADLESEYRSQELQDRSRRILTTCGGSPSYRGASAANVLSRMGFTDVSFVDGGMAALMSAGIVTNQP
jgi:rhodanese-related sulfurtransferase